MVPLAIGVVPYALAIGVTAAESDVNLLGAWAGSFLILAGAAQLATIELLDAGAAPVIAVLTGLVINARLVMYSAGLAPWFREESSARRALLAVFVIDQTYLVSTDRFLRGDLGRRERRAFFLGGALLLATVWVSSQTVAVLVGTGLPESLSLHVAAPLAVVGLLAKSVTTRPAVVAASAGALVAVVAVGMPFHSGLLVAGLAGVVAATVVARRSA
jgi:predicted branched-subunit amino acid permease